MPKTAPEGAEPEKSSLVETAKAMRAEEETAAKAGDAGKAPGSAEEPAEEAGAAEDTPKGEEPAQEPEKPDPAAAEAKEEDEAAAKDPRTKRSLDFAARRISRERKAMEAERAADRERLKAAEPTLAIVDKLGPDAPRLLETAAKLRDLPNAIKRDPLGTLAALGLTDFTTLAPIVVRAALGDAAPPDVVAKVREIQEKATRAGETDETKTALVSLQAEIAALKQEKTLAAVRAEVESVVGAAAPEDIPVLRVRMESEKGKQEVMSALLKIVEKVGGDIQSDELLLLAEESMQEEFGPEYTEWAKQRKPQPQEGAKKQTKQAGEKPSAKGLHAGATASPTRPRKEPETDEEREAAVLARVAERRRQREARD